MVAASGELSDRVHSDIECSFCTSLTDLTFRKSIKHGYRASILVFCYRRVNKRFGCKVGSEQFSFKEFKYHCVTVLILILLILGLGKLSVKQNGYEPINHTSYA